METKIRKDGPSMTLEIEGSIDTVTAPDLEKELNANWDGVTTLVLDFSKVDYISSAGLRVIMAADRHMSETESGLTIRNVNDDVKEVFEMTGFDELLKFE